MEATENDKRDFTFEIKWREDTDAALFQASSEIDRVRWIDAIEDAVGSLKKHVPEEPHQWIILNYHKDDV